MSVPAEPVAPFFDQTPESLAAHCAGAGLPPYTARQLLDWVYAKRITDVEQMSNLSRAQRRRVRAVLHFEQGTILGQQVASDDTRKLLIGWAGADESVALPVLERGRETETVLIPTEQRRTACVSSQIGCPVGCTFCASGLGGLDGNLTAGMIVEQIHHLRRQPGVDRVTNVVFMGMG